MNRFVRASLCGVSVAVPVGFLVVVSGGLLGGLYGALAAAFLCPLLSVPAWVCGFVVSLTTDKD
jgi:hypothetical protein